MSNETPPNILEEELAFFKEKKDEWLAHYEGKFALVKNHELADTFTTLDEAYQEGIKRFGTEAFLVKQILEKEPTQEVPALMLGLFNAHL